MYRGTPFLNRHIKRKEQERTMDYHVTNLTQIRPRTSTIDASEVHINNKKGQMQKEARFTEIQRENRILLEKISSIMTKPKQVSSQSQSQKLNRSLNSSLRKRQLQNIQVENAKLLRRLQQRRSNYETEKFKQSWRKQKNVIKNMSNYPFIISDRKRKRNSSTQLAPGRDARTSMIELSKIKTIDGVSFLITIRMGSEKLQIIGDTKTKKEIKVIQIERREAIEFIEQECGGRLENIFQQLRYDKVDEVLYLVAKNFDVEDFKESINQKKEDNPELQIQVPKGQTNQESMDKLDESEQQQEIQKIQKTIPQSESAKKYWVKIDQPQKQEEIPKNSQTNQQNIENKVEIEKKQKSESDEERKQNIDKRQETEEKKQPEGKVNNEEMNEQLGQQKENEEEGDAEQYLEQDVGEIEQSGIA